MSGIRRCRESEDGNRRWDLGNKGGDWKEAKGSYQRTPPEKTEVALKGPNIDSGWRWL